MRSSKATPKEQVTNQAAVSKMPCSGISGLLFGWQAPGGLSTVTGEPGQYGI